MASVIGNTLKLSVFGESHGEYVGATIENICPGIKISESFIHEQMKRRKADGKLTTSRIEEDKVQFVSGIYNGYTTGTPLTVLIKNNNVHSEDYPKGMCRPSSADYTQNEKYLSYQDYRGGGFASARITAPLVALGAILIEVLKKKNISIDSKIISIKGKTTEKEMEEEVLKAKEDLDSVGGIIQTTVSHLEKGIGEPFFDSLESDIAKAIFSIPGVKGIEFGLGFDFEKYTGSQVNDSLQLDKGVVQFQSNYSSGIQGGISNGEDIVFKTVFKPTSSIGKTQNSIDLVKKENVSLTIKGRHDPCICLRAGVIIDSLVAFCICDALCTRFGYLSMKEGK